MSYYSFSFMMLASESRRSHKNDPSQLLVMSLPHCSPFSSHVWVVGCGEAVSNLLILLPFLPTLKRPQFMCSQNVYVQGTHLQEVHFVLNSTDFDYFPF